MSNELRGGFTSALIQDIDDMFGYPDVSPRVGHEYQAEIPSLTNSVGLVSQSADSRSFGVGLPIPIMWVSKQSGMEEATNFQVTVTNKYESVETASSEKGYVNSKHEDVECEAEALVLGANGCKHSSGLSDIQESNCFPLPGSQVELWDITDQSLFLLGLYIFRKNLAQVKRFVGTKTMGDVLSYYYGTFYRSSNYQKWSEGRKSNSKRWIHGIKIFMGWRLQELVSRLSCYLPEERQKLLLEGSRMVGEDKMTIEEYIFTLKDWVGSDVLVEAIAIGKGKRDLTGTGMEPLKATHSVRTRPDIPVGKDFSSLSSVEILEVLTGDSRLSKARSSDLFFEAVWPRLLAKGWQSSQPRDAFSKLSVIYLPPDIKEFSQGLIRGDEYFDSISDILKEVASNPQLLELGEGAVQVKEDPAEDMLISPQEKEVEILSNDHHHSYLQKPHVRRCDSMKFMVVDTSLASEGEETKVRELRSLPIGCINVNKPRSSLSERNYSTNVAECVTEAKSYIEQAYSGTILSVDELPRDSAQLIGMFGKPEGLRNIISDEQSRVVGQPSNIVASFPQQLNLISCSQRDFRHGNGNISTEESLTGGIESSKELSSSSSASIHVKVPKTNHHGVSDESSYPRIEIDLNIPHSSLGSEYDDETITSEMQNNVNLSADRKSHMSDISKDISDISKDPNASDILNCDDRVGQQPVEYGRRQSTRNRPSARALEAIAYGFFDTKKKRKTMSTDHSNSRRRVQAKSTDHPILNNVLGDLV
ncbi:hypothetical protein Leryth_004897 [Lithospermum erythrorhizon]|nr:hypothetical protein Leryth_004897 [Lithospermum erythrorhizon]